MSSPTVVAFQPPSAFGGCSIARFVLPHADGKAPRDVVHPLLRILEAENQHVLGEPAFLRAR
jgi:hypothetical protein